MIKAICSKKNLAEQIVYYSYVRDILLDEDFVKLEKYKHHHYTTRLQHCINVSYYTYLICRKWGIDEKSGARAGLLHDLFFYNRKEYVRKSGEQFHMARHPKIALENAQKKFELNEIEKEIILKHMWPLTISLPHYRETVAIIIADKYCALMEFLFCRRSYKKLIKK